MSSQPRARDFETYPAPDAPQISRVLTAIRDIAVAEKEKTDETTAGTFPRVDPFRQADPFQKSTR